MPAKEKPHVLRGDPFFFSMYKSMYKVPQKRLFLALLRLNFSCGRQKRKAYKPYNYVLVSLFSWSECRDSNPRPLAPEASAIPNFATPRFSALDNYIRKRLEFQALSCGIFPLYNCLGIIFETSWMKEHSYGRYRDFNY